MRSAAVRDAAENRHPPGPRSDLFLIVASIRQAESIYPRYFSFIAESDRRYAVFLLLKRERHFTFNQGSEIPVG